ncbi:zinc finger protein 239-like isoform X2 [Photinus pyralis]|nr:zinc finger protein 239-like isoform X2 [Photinus pyralis]
MQIERCNESIQENCRLCQQVPGIINVIQNKEFMDKVFGITKVKINHDQMQFFPKSVCAACHLSVEQMHNFIQQIQLVNKKLHSIILPLPVKSAEHNANTQNNETFSIKSNDSKCHICAKLFETDRCLEIHKRTHTAQLNCIIQDNKNNGDSDTCDFISDNEDHENAPTEDSPTDAIPTENGIKDTSGTKCKKTERTFPCTFPNCTKVCTSLYTVRTHLMKHEGRTPFLCVTCGKGFRTKNSLNCHEKIHAEVKPYVCDECNIRFSVSSNLRAHQKKHHEALRDMNWFILV